jgi:hypothetical protein
MDTFLAGKYHLIGSDHPGISNDEVHNIHNSLLLIVPQ